MSIIVYIYMFVIGALLGSFYTLAVYRIPLKQDILYTRSYCPNCNHKLGFWDLIPIFSYIFLGAKCRYCKKKIRPRYLILELLSGSVYLIYAILLKIDIMNIQKEKIITLLFGILFFSTIIISLGIFKEYKKIPRSVFNFGIVVEICYMIYLYVLNMNIYRYIIYAILLLMLALINNINKNDRIRLISFSVFSIIGFIEIILFII